ncbi:MAG: class I SAM-dependent methyltransferase [Acidobacteriota bacterium]|nr:MAG: class I SAM-dependent methyltransferase [Acidobacteriota bacterium]
MHEFAHYLEAKRTVDDRSLDRRVLERLRGELEGVDAPAVVDVGAGIGTGLERLLDWNVVNEFAYTAVEQDAALVEIARARLHGRAQTGLVASTLADFASDNSNLARFDLVMAHAFLDIVDLAPAVKSLVALARPGGLLYFPITFDGETVFEPAHEDDETILSRYHASMDDVGNGKTGRRLFHALSSEPVDVLEMGSSDWIVRPESGGYPNDEAFFLEFVIGMIERTVGKAAEGWASVRRRQIEERQLLYIAHQIDCLARKR